MMFTFPGEINARESGGCYVASVEKKKSRGKLRAQRGKKSRGKKKSVPDDGWAGTGAGAGLLSDRRTLTAPIFLGYITCADRVVQLLETFPGAGAHLCPPIHFEFELAQYSPILSNVLT